MLLHNGEYIFFEKNKTMNFLLSNVFSQEWAIHRGKYKAGDKVDPATWKTRLRCALNKLGDIKELKHRSNLEGNDPFRVYQLMPEQDKSKRKTKSRL